MSTPGTTISPPATSRSVDELKFAHRWILRRSDLFEEEWATKMFDHGYQFAAHFASIFTGKEQIIETMLLQSPAEPGDPHNWFWMWWQFKWMQDDWNYINDKVYQQPISYDHYKTYMLHCEILEQDLLDILTTKQTA